MIPRWIHGPSVTVPGLVCPTLAPGLVQVLVLARGLVVLLVLTLSLALAGPANALVAPDVVLGCEVRLLQFDLFNYRSPETDRGGAEVEASLRSSLGGDWKVYAWNPQTRTPSDVIGSGVDVAPPFSSDEDVVGVARGIIQGHPEVFHADLSDLRVAKVPHGAGKWAVHFQQTYRGLDVWGGRAQLVFTEGGRLFVMGSTCYPGVDVDSRPSLTATVAGQVALRSLPSHAPSDSVGDQSELFILPVPRSETEVEYRLAWRVWVFTREPLGQWATCVDAHTGEILRRENGVLFNYLGTAQGPIERPSWCESAWMEPLPYLRCYVDGLGATYADGAGNWYQSSMASDPRTVTASINGLYADVWSRGGGSALFVGVAYPDLPLQVLFNDGNAQRDELDVYKTINDIHDFFETFSPGWGYTNAVMHANVGWPLTCNAYYSVTDNTINFYQEGNGCAATGRIMSMVGHEYGHGLNVNMYGGYFEFPELGMQEGNADVLGNVLVNESVMGRGRWIGHCAEGARNSDNALQYPGDVIGHDEYGAGMVIAGFHWDFLEQLCARYGLSYGRTLAAKDWHWGRVLYQPMNQPAQVLATFIADDDDGNLLNGTPEYGALCLAARNHGYSCPTAWTPLADGVCRQQWHSPAEYSIFQDSPRWIVAGVNAAPGDNKCFLVRSSDGSELERSESATWPTNFVVGDIEQQYNTSYTASVYAGSLSQPYVVQWDSGPTSFPLGQDVVGAVGGTEGNCGVVRIWSVGMEAGKTYLFQLAMQSGSADVRMALYRNPGSASYWAARGDAVFNLSAGAVASYAAPTTGIYGVVVYDNSAGSPSSTYSLRIQEGPTALASNVCQFWYPSPKMFSYNQANTHWAAVAVNPTGTDDKDIAVYAGPDGAGTPLASSVLGTGTDFVVADYNHASLGLYYPRVSYGGTGEPYLVEWSGEASLFPLGSSVSGTVGGDGGTCGLVRTWDLGLESGKTYRFSMQASGADIRACLYRNPSNSAYFAGRSALQMELQNGATFEYIAPATDIYGLVVFNNSGGSFYGSYTVAVREAAVPLASPFCQLPSGVPRLFSLAQTNSYWTCVGVNPTGTDDKDVAVYDNADAFGTPLASSTYGQGTDFVIGDFNHNPTGSYWPQVTYGNPSANYVVQWDDGPDILPLGTDVAGTMHLGTGGCGLVSTWDLFLLAGKTYRFSLTKTGSAEPRLALFQNPASAPFWAGRSASTLEMAANGAASYYTAPAGDWYGVVVFNNAPDSPAGTFAVRVSEMPPMLSGATCQAWEGVPRVFGFDQAETYWTAVAVNPSPGDTKSLAICADPEGAGTPLASSAGGTGTSLLVGDFNHLPVGAYYPRVYDGGGSVAFVLEWDNGPDLLPMGTDVTGSVGGAAGSCGLVRSWDVVLTAGVTYTMTLQSGGGAQVVVALFRNPTNAPYWAGRAAAQFEKIPAQTPYVFTVPATDAYGIVVFNDAPGSPAGDFRLRLDGAAPGLPDLAVLELQLNPPSPTIYDPVLARAHVRNQGAADAGASVSRVWLDGAARGDLATPALASLQDVWTNWCPLGLSLPAGPHEVEVCADALEVVQEGDETNNCLTLPFTVLSSSGAPNADGRSGPVLQVGNPYRAGSPIRLNVGPRPARVRLGIYNVHGQLLRSLGGGQRPPGLSEFGWDGRTEIGTEAGTGICYLRAEVGVLRVTKSLLLVR